MHRRDAKHAKESPKAYRTPFHVSREEEVSWLSHREPEVSERT